MADRMRIKVPTGSTYESSKDDENKEKYVPLGTLERTLSGEHGEFSLKSVGVKMLRQRGR